MGDQPAEAPAPDLNTQLLAAQQQNYVLSAQLEGLKWSVDDLKQQLSDKELLQQHSRGLEDEIRRLSVLISELQGPITPDQLHQLLNPAPSALNRAPSRLLSSSRTLSDDMLLGEGWGDLSTRHTTLQEGEGEGEELQWLQDAQLELEEVLEQDLLSFEGQLSSLKERLGGPAPDLLPGSRAGQVAASRAEGPATTGNTHSQQEGGMQRSLLESELVSTKRRLSSCEERNKALVGQAAAARQAANEATQRVEELQHMMKGAERAGSLLRSEQQLLQMQLESSQTKLAGSSVWFEDLKVEVQDAAKQMHSVKQELKESRSYAQGLEAQVGSLKSRVLAADADRSQLQELLAQLKATERELLAAEQRGEKLQGERDKVAKSAEAASTQLLGLREQLEQVKKQAGSSKQRSEELEAELSVLQLKVASKAERIVALTESEHMKVSSMEEKMQELVDECELLRDEKEQAEQRAASLEEEVGILTEELQDAEAASEAHQAEYQKLRENLARLAQRKHEHDQVAEENQLLQEQLAASSEKLANVEWQLEQLRSQSAAAAPAALPSLPLPDSNSTPTPSDSEPLQSKEAAGQLLSNKTAAPARNDAALQKEQDEATEKLREAEQKVLVLQGQLADAEAQRSEVASEVSKLQQHVKTMLEVMQEFGGDQAESARKLLEAHQQVEKLQLQLSVLQSDPSTPILHKSVDGSSPLAATENTTPPQVFSPQAAQLTPVLRRSFDGVSPLAAVQQPTDQPSSSSRQPGVATTANRTAPWGFSPHVAPSPPSPFSQPSSSAPAGTLQGQLVRSREGPFARGALHAAVQAGESAALAEVGSLKQQLRELDRQKSSLEELLREKEEALADMEIDMVAVDAAKEIQVKALAAAQAGKEAAMKLAEEKDQEAKEAKSQLERLKAHASSLLEDQKASEKAVAAVQAELEAAMKLVAEVQSGQEAAEKLSAKLQEQLAGAAAGKEAAEKVAHELEAEVAQLKAKVASISVEKEFGEKLGMEANSSKEAAEKQVAALQAQLAAIASGEEAAGKAAAEAVREAIGQQVVELQAQMVAVVNLKEAAEKLASSLQTAQAVAQQELITLRTEQAEAEQRAEALQSGKEALEQLLSNLAADKEAAEQLASKLLADKEAAEQLAMELRADKEAAMQLLEEIRAERKDDEGRLQKMLSANIAAEEVVEELQAGKEATEAEAAALRAGINVAELEAATLRAGKEAAKAEVEQLRADKLAAEAQSQELWAGMEVAEAKLAELQAGKDAAEKLVQELREGLAKSQGEQQLRAADSLREAEQQVVELMMKLSEVELKLADREKITDGLQQRLAVLSEEKEAATKLAASSKDTCKRLELQLQEASGKLEQLENEVAALGEGKAAAEQLVTALSKGASESADKVAAADRRVQVLQEELEQASTDNAAVKEALEVSQRELEDANTARAAAVEQVGRSHEQLLQLHDEVNASRSQLMALVEKKASLSEQLSDTNEQLQDAMQKLAAADKTIAGMEQDLKNAMAEKDKAVSHLQHQLSVQEQRAEVAAAEAATTRHKLASIENQQQVARKELDERTKQFTGLERARSTLERQLSIMGPQMEQLQVQRDNAEAAAAAAEKSAAQLRQWLSEAQLRVADLESAEREAAEALERCGGLEKDNVALRERVAQQEAQVAEFGREQADLSRQVVEAQGQVLHMNEQLALSQQQVASMSHSSSCAAVQVEALQQQVLGLLTTLQTYSTLSDKVVDTYLQQADALGVLMDSFATTLAPNTQSSLPSSTAPAPSADTPISTIPAAPPRLKAPQPALPRTPSRSKHSGSTDTPSSSSTTPAPATRTVASPHRTSSRQHDPSSSASNMHSLLLSAAATWGSGWRNAPSSTPSPAPSSPSIASHRGSNGQPPATAADPVAAALSNGSAASDGGTSLTPQQVCKGVGNALHGLDELQQCMQSAVDMLPAGDVARMALGSALRQVVELKQKVSELSAAGRNLELLDSRCTHLQGELSRSAMLMCNLEQRVRGLEDSNQQLIATAEVERKRGESMALSWQSELDCLGAQPREAWPLSIRQLVEEMEAQAREGVEDRVRSEMESIEGQLADELQSVKYSLAEAVQRYEECKHNLAEARQALTNYKEEMSSKEVSFRRELSLLRSEHERSQEEFMREVVNASRDKDGELEAQQQVASNWKRKYEGAQDEIVSLKDKVCLIMQEKDEEIAKLRRKFLLSSEDSLGIGRALSLDGVTGVPALHSPSSEITPVGDDATGSHSNSFNLPLPPSVEVSRIVVDPSGQAGAAPAAAWRRVVELERQVADWRGAYSELEHTMALRVQAEAVLKEEVQRLQSVETLGNMDLKYVRSVVLSGYKNGELPHTTNMFNVLSRLLAFTPAEVEQIQKRKRRA